MTTLTNDFCIFALIFTILYVFKRLFSSSPSISKVPGPPSFSFLYGNLPQLLQAEAGEVDFDWTKQYGSVVRVRAPLGEDMLLVSDPKALHYIYQNSGYRFCRHRERRLFGHLLSGVGITWAEGADHKRQRKVIAPAFGVAESKALVPFFVTCASKMTSKWLEMVNASSDQTATLDFHAWISLATMDALGYAAFDYEFRALDNGDSELSSVYKNFFVEVFGAPTNASILALSLARMLPSSMILYLFQISNAPRIRRMRRTGDVSMSVSRRLAEQKAAALLAGKDKKDVMSLIVKANAAEGANSQLTEEEMLSIMQVMMIAGHDTTAISLTWAVFELCKHPEIQSKLRKEILAKKRELIVRGDATFTAEDFDSMHYLTALIKESLRFHPVAPNLWKQVTEDDVLPLTNPIATLTGKLLHQLPIRKGTKVIASIAAYNRNQTIFGDDADFFNPDRWTRNIETKKLTTPGVYGNMMTFSGGLRACIGWRFAVLEMQAMLVEMISNFDFSLDVPVESIRRESCHIMMPTVAGQADKGSQLPVKIRPVGAD